MFANAKIEQRGPNQYDVTHGDDTQLFVEFRQEAVHRPYLSEMEGRPVYENVDFITIFFAGDTTKKVDRVATEDDKRRFAKQYRAYVDGITVASDGTPLEVWPPLTKADVASFKAMHIHTVEQLAAVTDVNLSAMGAGARSFRDQAKVYLSQSKSSAEISKRDSKIRDLEDQINVLRTQLEQVSDLKKRG